MGFFKDLMRVPKLYVSAFSWRKGKKKKKKPVSVEIHMDKETKDKLKEVLTKVEESAKSSVREIYEELRSNGQLDRLFDKVGELLVKAGTIIEDKTTKTITVATPPDHRPDVPDGVVHITGTKEGEKAGAVHGRPERKNAKKPDGGPIKPPESGGSGEASGTDEPPK
jgi:hypothetical protein